MIAGAEPVLKLVASPDETAQWEQRYRSGGMGYGEVKKRLVELTIEYFKPYRQKRAELESNLDVVDGAPVGDLAGAEGAVAAAMGVLRHRGRAEA